MPCLTVASTFNWPPDLIQAHDRTSHLLHQVAQRFLLGECVIRRQHQCFPALFPDGLGQASDTGRDRADACMLIVFGEPACGLLQQALIGVGVGIAKCCLA